MSRLAIQKDIGAFIVGKNALNPQTLNTTDSGTEVTGHPVDRGVGDASTGVTNQLQHSGQVVVNLSYRVSAAESLSVVSHVETASATGSTSWTNLDDKDGSSEVSKTLATTGTTTVEADNAELRYDLDLAPAKRYVRVTLTPTFGTTTTASTSDVDVSAVMVLGGYQITPAST